MSCSTHVACKDRPGCLFLEQAEAALHKIYVFLVHKTGLDNEGVKEIRRIIEQDVDWM